MTEPRPASTTGTVTAVMDSEMASALLHEASEARRMYVDRMVNAKINARNGSCSNAEITEWEHDAYRRWRAKFPTLNRFLIPHGTDENDGDSSG